MPKTILILAANPLDTDRLTLDHEQKAIEEARLRSPLRDEFQVKVAPAVRWEDVRRQLMAIEPEIVHFVGHGEGAQGLVLEDDGAAGQLVTGDRWAVLFGLFPMVKCVVLNACRTEGQAIAIHGSVNCVVGMSQRMGDGSARRFSLGFYDAVFAGDGYRRAFELGRSAIVSPQDAMQPMLRFRELVRAVVELEPPGSRMPIESRFYVERPRAEEDACREVMQAGGLVRIKAPHEYGKSSLMARVVAHAAGAGAKTVSINFREIDSIFLESLTDFLVWFCNSVTEDLGFEGELDEKKGKAFSYKKACGNYFEKQLLPQISQSLVLELDEVDQLLDQHQERRWVVDFFSMLRAWHDSKMKSHPEWKKLRLVLVHSKEIDQTMFKDKQSPFNVGWGIELSEFTEEQVVQLADLHSIKPDQAKQLMAIVGGHPQLIRMGLYAIARGDTLDQIQVNGATESGLYGRHLMQMRSRIERHTSLKSLLRRVLAYPEGISLELHEKAILRSFGVVMCHGNDVKIACELYNQYFSGLGL